MRLFGYLSTGLCFLFGISQAQFPPMPPGPPPFNNVTFNIPMSDGQILTSTLYTRKGVQLGDANLVVYYQAFPYTADVETEFAYVWTLDPLVKLQHNQGLLLHHMRGTRPGSGEFKGFHRLEDIKDCIDWLHKQKWFSGVLFGTGYSAMGSLSYMSVLVGVQYTAQSVAISAADEYHFVYQNGALRKQFVNGMLKFVGQPQYINTYLQHEGPDDFWKTTDAETHFGNVKWPAVHLAGWWDVFQKDSLMTYENYRTRADPSVRDLQFLIINPSGHCFTGGAVNWGNRSQQVFQLLNIGLQDLMFAVLQNAGTPEKFNARLAVLKVITKFIPRVFWYVMGPGLPGTKGNWMSVAHALPTPTMTPFYLGPNGQLTRDPPALTSVAQYIFDPSNPVRTWGGCNMGAPPGAVLEMATTCGPWDQLRVSKGRTDVLLYNSAPLDQPMALTGAVKVVLYVSTNATDTDFTAKLVDVFPNGTRLLIADGIQRMRWREPKKGPQLLVPGQVYSIEVDLWGTSYIFAIGHSIGIDVSSSNFPRFDVNPNTGVPIATQQPGNYVLAQNTIHLGSSYASHIQLPVVPMHAVAPILPGALDDLLDLIQRSRSQVSELEAAI